MGRKLIPRLGAQNIHQAGSSFRDSGHRKIEISSCKPEDHYETQGKQNHFVSIRNIKEF